MNILTFTNNYKSCEEIPNDLYELMQFTRSSKHDRTIANFSKICNNNGGYTLNYCNKLYQFSVFSDWDLQKFDKEVLESDRRVDNGLFRSLKLSCSMDLISPRIVIGNSLVEIFSLLIIFNDKGVDRVIDYDKNLVMNKDDYYEIFKFQELNVVDKVDLSNIYNIVDMLGDYEHIYEYLIFTKEIFKDLSRNENFKFLTQKYDEYGINRCNSIFLGVNSDILFFSDCDYKCKYDEYRQELCTFTENPLKFSRHILYDNNNNFKMVGDNLEPFKFNLLSNILFGDEEEINEIKELLLSDQRYHYCHFDSVNCAFYLNEDSGNIYIVGGMIKENEKDYILHSWVEINSKNRFIDFTKNLEMDIDRAYEFFGAKPINKISLTEMAKIINFVYNRIWPDFPQFYLNYFGKEIIQDLKKNEKIFQK